VLFPGFRPNHRAGVELAAIDAHRVLGCSAAATLARPVYHEGLGTNRVRTGKYLGP
jgi:hypothetical protein